MKSFGYTTFSSKYFRMILPGRYWVVLARIGWLPTAVSTSAADDPLLTLTLSYRDRLKSSTAKKGVGVGFRIGYAIWRCGSQAQPVNKEH